MDYLQYVDGDSVLHRLDPRTKFVFLVVMALVTSVVKSGVALAFLAAFFFALWKTTRILPYMMTLLKMLKVLLVFIFLLWLVLGLFEEPPVAGGPVFFRRAFTFAGGAHVLCLDWYDFYKGFVYSLRIFLMIASFYTVLVTTNFSQVILGLQKWRVPYGVAFGIGLVFQIIPMVIRELHTIMEAESSRGLEIERCDWWTKVKNYVTFSFPLLFRVIGKGQAISLAMHYYRLDFSVRRTAYKEIRATRADVVFSLVCLAAVAATVALRVLFYIPV